MENWEQILFVVCILAFYTIKFVVKLLIKKRKYELCPICHQETKLKWRAKKEDATKKPVRMGSKYVFGGKVITYRFVILCEHCNHEIEI